MPKVEQLLLGAVTVIFLPMILFCGYSAYLGVGEGARLRAAPELVQGAPATDGALYRVRGPLAGGLITPKDYHPVADALQMRITRQTRSDASSENWVDDETAAIRYLRAEDLKIDGVPIEVSETTRVAAPVEETYDQRAPTVRDHVHYRAAGGRVWIAFGTLSAGALRDTRFEKVLLVREDELEAALEQAGAAGRSKGLILGIIAVVLTALAALSANAARRSGGGRRDFGQVVVAGSP